ncbi:MAG: VCBS repeat-containing protein, partial [Bacteroidales bacterium]|nr:VCBS repeat-containing protein [Bacteroidales bacterium]
MSTFGPALSVGDINNDGLEDFFIGGAKGFGGAVYTQHSDGSFNKTPQKDIFLDRGHEDTDAQFFDADRDGDLDLYVISGGNELPAGDDYYQDRLYFNNGEGRFLKSPNALPSLKASGGVIRANDFDGDGDLDLFVGGRLLPGQYPKPGRSYLLENVNGKFKDVTAEHTKELEYPGMVTDALWSDYDGDGTKDLILVGEWMSPQFFRNDNGTFTNITLDYLPESIAGLWRTIQPADINNDGNTDYLLGNWGLNSKFHASHKFPLKMYVDDFDGNGQIETLIAMEKTGEYYPINSKDEIDSQLEGITRKRFLHYSDFAGKT